MLFANKQRFLSIITVTNYAKEKIFTICNKKSKTKITSTDKMHNPEKKIFPNICQAGNMFLVPDITNMRFFFKKHVI